MEYVLHQSRNWRGVQLNRHETRRLDEENLKDTQVDIYSSYTLCVCVLLSTRPYIVLDRTA